MVHVDDANELCRGIFSSLLGGVVPSALACLFCFLRLCTASSSSTVGVMCSCLLAQWLWASVHQVRRCGMQDVHA